MDKMKNLNNLPLEEKAQCCKDLFKGKWALKGNRVDYCFLVNEKPSCAKKIFLISNFNYACAETRDKKESLIEKHYLCSFGGK